MLRGVQKAVPDGISLHSSHAVLPQLRQLVVLDDFVDIRRLPDEGQAGLEARGLRSQSRFGAIEWLGLVGRFKEARSGFGEGLALGSSFLHLLFLSSPVFPHELR